MLPETPEKKDAPKPKERPIVNLNSKPSLSTSDRAWLYAMILAITSFFASIWLAVLGEIDSRQVLLFIALLLATMVFKPTPSR